MAEKKSPKYSPEVAKSKTDISDTVAKGSPSSSPSSSKIKLNIQPSNSHIRSNSTNIGQIYAKHRQPDAIPSPLDKIKLKPTLILDITMSSDTDTTDNDTDENDSDHFPEEYKECARKLLRFMESSITARTFVLDQFAPHIKMDYVYCLILDGSHYRIKGLFDDQAAPANWLFAKIGKTANEDAHLITKMLSESANSEILVSDYLKQMRASSSKSRLYSISNGFGASRYIYTLKLCMFMPADDFLGQKLTTETIVRSKLGCSLDSNWYSYLNDGSPTGQSRIGVNEWVITNRVMLDRFKKFTSLYEFHRLNMSTPNDFRSRDVQLQVYRTSGNKELLFQRRWAASPSTTRVGTPKSNRKEEIIKK